MNGQSEYQEFGNKKKKQVDVEPVSKKAARKQQKNLNKTITTTKLIQQFEQKKTFQKQDNNFKKVQKGSESNLDPKQKKKIDDLKAILQHHKRDTIRKALQKHNYDKQLAMQQLFSIPQDETTSPPTKIQEKYQKSQQKKQKKKKQQTKQQIANEIMNDYYQNNQQIDPSQFQILFAQITNIIEQQQKIQGMDLLQINDFIDQCYLVKNVILEGQDNDQIYIDQSDQLYRQTQIFMEELIKNRVSRQNKRKQDFPALNQINKSQPNQKNYIQKIQDQYKEQKRKQEYFTPSKVPQVYRSQNNNNHKSVFSIKNNPRSYQDILQLSKEYNDMGIDNLKFIYYRFGDINLCKEFLDRFYPGKKKQMKIQKIEKSFKNTFNQQERKPSNFIKSKRVQDENYKNYSLRDIRQELDHLFKLRTMFRMTRGKTTNQGYRKELERLACRDDPKIKKLSEIARYKVVQEMAEQNPQYIDLHGYRQEQIDELFDQIQDMIRSQFNKGNSKLDTTKLGTNVYCIVKVMTGKGLHSKYNKSVLKPALLEWCAKNNVKTTQTDDSINVYIQVR